MSLSLREQLLKAGLVTEKQAKKAERQTSQQQHQRKKGSLPDPTPEQQAAVRKAQAAKFARDQALNRERQEKAAIKAVAQPVDSKPQWRLWTDNFNNLFQILK
jgi:uncharacterized protein YaiL (DUF2058 family)